MVYLPLRRAEEKVEDKVCELHLGFDCARWQGQGRSILTGRMERTGRFTKRLAREWTVKLVDKHSKNVVIREF
jgi:hypothetical protein